jgi:hypothetical protein
MIVSVVESFGSLPNVLRQAPDQESNSQKSQHQAGGYQHFADECLMWKANQICVRERLFGSQKKNCAS